ncbi:MAG: hypothetical protein COB14_05155 [Alphaproteobacteria bacterium]|nr:MAG: hypothetical protein COB14_05155 [Alphaproteobacteria bacterium]
MQNPTNNLLKKTAISLALVFDLAACTTVPTPSENTSPMETRKEQREMKGFSQDILDARKRVESGDVLRETEKNKEKLSTPMMRSETEDASKESQIGKDDTIFSPPTPEVE